MAKFITEIFSVIGTMQRIKEQRELNERIEVLAKEWE
jgi:hypothetical protein